MKNKSAAIALAFFLGGIGAHKFYLGKPGLGILYAAFCWTFIPSFIAFIEVLYLLTLSQEQFSEMYDEKKPAEETPLHDLPEKSEEEYQGINEKYEFTGTIEHKKTDGEPGTCHCGQCLKHPDQSHSFYRMLVFENGEDIRHQPELERLIDEYDNIGKKVKITVELIDSSAENKEN